MIKQLYDSNVFGNSVFDGVKTAVPGKKGETIAKPNDMFQTILKKYSGKDSSKYLILKNVILDTSYQLVDIHILLTCGNGDPKMSKDALSQLLEWHTFTKK